jgi:hypothetical protein
MSEIENTGITVEEYLEGLEAGIDIITLKQMEAKGIPRHLALEAMEIGEKAVNGTATPEEIVRGLMIFSPKLRQQLE